MPANPANRSIGVITARAAAGEYCWSDELERAQRGPGWRFSGLDRAGPRRSRPRVAHPGRSGREPEPRGGERRASLDRPGVRRGPDGTQSDRGRLFARPRRLGALLRRDRRSLWAQADADSGDGAVDSGVRARGLGADGRSPLRRAPPRWALRRDGVPDHACADHGALVGAWAHEVDRAVVGHRRRHLRPRPGARRRALGGVLVGLGLPAHPAARCVWRFSWP